MKKIHFLLMGFKILAMNVLTAAIYYELDTTVPLQCSFSCKHPNRIMIEKQGIEKIIHSEPDSIQILIEEKANQAFVMACEEIEDPVTLCVITSNGDVQDIEVNFQDQPSQLVILQQKKPIQKLEIPSFEDNQMQSVIRSILNGKIPTDFSTMTFVVDPIYLRKKIKVVEISRFEREFEIIRVFKISNCSKQRQIIHEKELATENSSWIFLEKNTLIPKESILAIISIEKDGSQ